MQAMSSYASSSHSVSLVVRALITRDDRYMLVRDKRFDGDLWELTGGKLEIGDHPSQAIAREIMEETGWLMIPEGILAIRSCSWEEMEEGRSLDIIYYAEANAQVREHPEYADRCAWFTLAEMRDLEKKQLIREPLASLLDTLPDPTLLPLDQVIEGQVVPRPSEAVTV